MTQRSVTPVDSPRHASRPRWSNGFRVITRKGQTSSRAPTCRSAEEDRLLKAVARQPRTVRATESLEEPRANFTKGTARALWRLRRVLNGRCRLRWSGAGATGALLRVAPLEVLVFVTVTVAIVRRAHRGPEPWLLVLGCRALLLGMLQGKCRREAPGERPPGRPPAAAIHRTSARQSQRSWAHRWKSAVRFVGWARTSRRSCATVRRPLGPASRRSTAALQDLARGDVYEVIAQLAPPERHLWNDATGDPRPSEGGSAQGPSRSGGIIDALVSCREATRAASLVDRFRAHVRARIEACPSRGTRPPWPARSSSVSPTSRWTMTPRFARAAWPICLPFPGCILSWWSPPSRASCEAALLRVERLSARVDVERVAAVAAIGLAWLYADFAGGGGSTVRAAWMMTVAYAARAIGRRCSGPRAFRALRFWRWPRERPSRRFRRIVRSVGSGDGRPSGICASLPSQMGPVAQSRSAWASAPWGRLVNSGAVGTTLPAATVPCTPILARFAPSPFPLGGVLCQPPRRRPRRRSGGIAPLLDPRLPRCRFHFPSSGALRLPPPGRSRWFEP